MLHSTKYSEKINPNEVNEFVFKNLNKPTINLAKFEDNSIFFEVENNIYKTISFVITDYYIECQNKGVTTKKLTKNWQKYMANKFGKEYIDTYNNFNSQNMEL